MVKIFLLSLWKQFVSLIPVLVLTCIPPVFILAAVAIFMRVNHQKMSVVLNDPASITGTPFYYGFISNLGVLLWTAAAAICLFSSFLLPASNRKERTFLCVSGIFTVFLLLDDLLMLHEAVFPNYLHISGAVYAFFYFLLLGTYLVFFTKTILKTDFILLAMALFLFVISIGFDLTHDRGLMKFTGEMFLEDGSKFIGITVWLAYFARTSCQCVLRSSATKEGPL